ncbi:histidine phosphatase family protein [Bacillus sp. UMB0893]|uniref:histidine phosphatase family protein n=1 Tax=Bacillus sp. UMB0893 TaxID=2066053 RepID=UPI000C768903|nr:histidine phosphatase family protein [Bacillus sp. UMB0893]PLR68614.1 hypothetical protein CYJ36_06475 [Bacillus sp. UMB0893]
MESCRSLQLVIIRHSMTSWNKEKKYLGHMDLPVLKDSLLSYESLKRYLSQGLPDAVYSSDLLRCQQTADFLYPDTPFLTDERLRELDFGEWEGQTYDELKNDSHYSYWLQHWEKTSTPNGESGEEFHKRIASFINDILNQNVKSIAIITHGGVIRKIVSELIQDLSYWDVAAPFGQAAVLHLQKEGGEWRCISLSAEPAAAKGSL